MPNLHRVGDRLYRSAKPTTEGARQLVDLGVKTVINLELFHSDRDALRDTDLGYEHIRVEAWRPEDDEVVRFLEIVLDDAKTPALVHCWHGADRTGLMSAIYRVAVDGWTKDDALREMKDGGFGFHSIWINIPPYFAKLDIAALKAQVLENLARARDER